VSIQFAVVLMFQSPPATFPFHLTEEMLVTTKSMELAVVLLDRYPSVRGGKEPSAKAP
jgi:hypothetical protein